MSYTKVGTDKYRIFISDGTNLDGSRRRFSKTITTDLKGRDLEKFLILAEFDFEDEIKKKDPRFLELGKGSFEAYSNWWINYKSTHENIADKTKQEYQKFLDTRILKYIGCKTLDKLTNSDMLELMKLIKESPSRTKSGKLSDKTIKHYHTLLKTMFNDAIKLKIISDNPMDNVPVKTPKVKLKDNYYDLEDVKKVLDLLLTQPIKYQLAALLAISTGMRVGEISALQWKHINLDKTQIKIEQSNAYTKERGTFIKDTKNHHSERTVAFPKTLINLFKAHEDEEMLKKKALGDNWYYENRDHKDDFVFTQKNGKVIFKDTISDWWKKFRRMNDLKEITFHGLRHTNTTILINKGINIVSISSSLGHSKTSTTTDFYAHHLESVEREMANTFDDILVDNNQSGSGSGSDSQHLRIVK